MALTKCRNCGHQISDKASHCINCGADNTAPANVYPGQYQQMPFSNTPRNHQRKSSNSNSPIALIIGCVAAFVLIVSAVVYFLCFRDKDYSDDYDDEPVVERTEESTSLDETEEQIAVSDPNGETDERFTDFSWLSNQYVSYGDIADLPSARLRILRNAIYARHNYSFQSADLQEYFGVYDWYEPLYTDVNNQLSPIEIENIKFLKSQE